MTGSLDQAEKSDGPPKGPKGERARQLRSLMRHFQRQVLSQAIRLRARSAELPAWLAQAKEALRLHESSGSTPAELAQALGGVEGWPTDALALKAELDQLALPVARMLSLSLCRLSKDAWGEPAAELWGGAARARADASGARIQGAVEASGEEMLDPSFFDREPILATAGPKTKTLGEPGVPHSSRARDARAQMAWLNAMGEGFLEDIARDKEMRVEDLSAQDRRIHDQVNADFADPERRQGSRGVLLMSDGELIETREYERHGALSEALDKNVRIKAVEGVSEIFAPSIEEQARSMGEAFLGLRSAGSEARDAFRAQALREAQRGFSVARTARGGADSIGAQARGFKRGEGLLRAVSGLGARAIEIGRELAHERLIRFLRENGALHAAKAGSGLKERLQSRREAQSSTPGSGPRPRGKGL